MVLRHSAARDKITPPCSGAPPPETQVLHGAAAAAVRADIAFHRSRAAGKIALPPDDHGRREDDCGRPDARAAPAGDGHALPGREVPALHVLVDVRGHVRPWEVGGFFQTRCLNTWNRQ